MTILLIFLTSLGSAYLAARLARYEAFTPADLGAGIFSGCVSSAAAHMLAQQGASGTIGLPVLLACGLAIGLGSLRRSATDDRRWTIDDR